MHCCTVALLIYTVCFTNLLSHFYTVALLLHCYIVVALLHCYTVAPLHCCCTVTLLHRCTVDICWYALYFVKVLLLFYSILCCWCQTPVRKPPCSSILLKAVQGRGSSVTFFLDEADFLEGPFALVHGAEEASWAPRLPHRCDKWASGG